MVTEMSLLVEHLNRRSSNYLVCLPFQFHTLASVLMPGLHKKPGSSGAARQGKIKLAVESPDGRRLEMPLLLSVI